MSTPNNCTAPSAADLIKRFGGPSKLGEEIGVGQSAVSMWNDRGIPGKWHLPLLRKAREMGISLTEEELLATINCK
jgi:hypothetical protein